MSSLKILKEELNVNPGFVLMLRRRVWGHNINSLMAIHIKR